MPSKRGLFIQKIFNEKCLKDMDNAHHYEMFIKKFEDEDNDIDDNTQLTLSVNNL